MSFQAFQEIRCPCGETFETELYESVSAGDNPDLKEMILGGEFNMVKCPSCFNLLYGERFVLYHDAAQELMAFVHPLGLESRKEELAAEMKASFTQLQAGLEAKLPYEPCLIFGMDRLCELIVKEDAIADEAAIAEFLCATLKLQAKKIHKSVARKKNIPPVLPLSKADKDFRASLLAGVKKLINENDRLEHYQTLLKEVESDPNWQL